MTPTGGLSFIGALLSDGGSWVLPQGAEDAVGDQWRRGEAVAAAGGPRPHGRTGPGEQRAAGGCVRGVVAVAGADDGVAGEVAHDRGGEDPPGPAERRLARLDGA